MGYFADQRKNELASKLKAFAQEQASLQNDVYWHVLRNKAIVSICKFLPRTVDDLYSKRVLLGKNAIRKYGEDIVRIVNEWCEHGDSAEHQLEEMCDSEGDTPPVPEDICDSEDDAMPMLENVWDSSNGAPPIWEEMCDHAEKAADARPDIFQCPSRPDQTGVMQIKKAGYYYMVSGNDALLLHKHFGYRLFGTHTPRTGFPVECEVAVTIKLDRLSIDYDLINGDSKLVSKRFENNLYEIIDADRSLWARLPKKTSKKKTKKKDTERLTAYRETLEALSRCIDATTGELVEGMSSQTRLQLLEMMIYFENELNGKS